MPIVKISKAVKVLSPGETLEVTADDPAFESDVRAWCDKTNHPLESLTRQGGDVTALIRKP
jgi:TusA-related sulfurtransferase